MIVVGQPSIRDTSFNMVEVIENHFAWWNFVEDVLAPGLNYRNSSDFNNPQNVRIYWESVDTKVSKCVISITSNDQLNRPYERALSDG